MYFGNDKNNARITKIKNGYTVEVTCEGENRVEYVKTLTKIPSILKRWFGPNEKRSVQKIEDMDREESVEKQENGTVKVKVTLKDK